MTESDFYQLVDPVRTYAIFLLDANGCITSWNQGAELLKGYKRSEIVGKHFSVFYPAESIGRCWPQRALEIAKQEGRFEDEGWRLRKDGSRFWASGTITTLRNGDGVPEGFLKITRDLTARKEAEEQNTRLVREHAAREAAEDAQRRALFLAETGQALAARVEEKEIYQTVVQAVVPFLADICLVDRLGGGCIARLAALNESKNRDRELRSVLNAYYPIKPGDKHFVAEVLRTGETRLFGSPLKIRKHIQVLQPGSRPGLS
jgi:PAS domain S-box-containing protein